MNMLSPYRIQPKNTTKPTKKTSNTNFDKISHGDRDGKRPRLTSKDPKPTSKEFSPKVKPMKSKNKMKSVGNIEINDEYLDEYLHKNKK